MKGKREGTGREERNAAEGSGQSKQKQTVARAELEGSKRETREGSMMRKERRKNKGEEK